MIRTFTIKALSQHIVQGQRSSLILPKGWAFKIDKEFFKAFKEKEVPYIHLCAENNFSKNMVIDPINRSFIQYLEDLKSNYKWQISYSEYSSSYKLVSVNTQNPELCNSCAYFNPFLGDCTVNENLEILYLGADSILER